MKLFIIGAAGSGKTTLAKRIGLRLGIEITNLDDLFWVNNGKNYGVKRPAPERDALLDSVLARESWIIEGAYVEWPRRGIEEADLILYLDRGLRELRKRIIMRFIRRKLGKDRENKIENLKSLTDLLAWNRKQIVAISACVGQLQVEGKNLRIARDEADIESFIAEILGDRRLT
ncbi:MAG: P-loop NTPase family protein [Spirochaetales bacterium]